MKLTDAFLLRRPAASSMNASRRFILWFSILSRIMVMSGMIASCALLPNFYPGNDVLPFNLRFGESENSGSPCFCLEGQAWCENDAKHTNETPGKCTSSQRINQSNRNEMVTKIYSVILPPFTRWDAARFLMLAVYPDARRPSTLQDHEKKCIVKDDNTCQEDQFASSEQAHAFFPLIPLVIRYASKAIFCVVPNALLPPTYEGVAVLAALTVNLLCFIFSALLLHDLTFRVTTRHASEKTLAERCLYCSQVTAMLFCINPASVFFSTSYSESVFCMLTFLGYDLCARGYVWLAVVPWAVASFGRSNGTMTALWLLQFGISGFLFSLQSSSSILRSCSLMLYRLLMAAFVTFPVIYHDWRGYDLHCSSEYSSSDQPMWCEQACKSSRPFSLYGFVQRKHWNVGFLRYYEAKQLPNFLLAAPVLYFGSRAALDWILCSWSAYEQTLEQKPSWRNPVQVIQWALFALQSSVAPCPPLSSSADSDDVLLTGPHMLGHYAVLALFCLVGATVAHVQVSTRLIFSSCPAVYWYMTKLLCKRDNEKFQAGQVIIYYCLGYIIAGTIMHVNWLPWT